MEHEENYESRPLRKADFRVKGKLLRWEGTDYVEFVPVQHGDQNKRSVIYSNRRSAYYKNEGEKESSYSLHINVPSTEKDPASALMEEALKALKPQMKEEPRIRVKKFLVDRDHLKVWDEKRAKKLVVRLELDTSQHPSLMMSDLSDLFKEVYRTVTTYKR